MPYIIDGHNLIPKIPGLSLRSVDDEIQLIELLQEFCRLTQKRVEVYFDNAPAGQLRVRKYGRVTAHFIRSGHTADQAIHHRLSRLQRAARNWTVVSSDHEVQVSAKRVHAQVLTSGAFNQLIQQTLYHQRQERETRDAPLSPDEVSEWLDLFGVDSDGED